MNNDIFEKLKAIAVNDIGIDADKVKPESDIIKELGLDSLDIVDMLMKVEETFGVTIDDSDVVEMKTVADASSRTLRHDGRGAAPAFRRQTFISATPATKRRLNTPREKSKIFPAGTPDLPHRKYLRRGPRDSLRSAPRRSPRRVIAGALSPHMSPKAREYPRGPAP